MKVVQLDTEWAQLEEGLGLKWNWGDASGALNAWRGRQSHKLVTLLRHSGPKDPQKNKGKGHRIKMNTGGLVSISRA